MGVFFRAQIIVAICLIYSQICQPYIYKNHPCCLEPSENVTLAMLIDAFEIYGHDPTDKLDNLWLYQNEMMRVKTAEDQYKINERVHIATDHLSRFITLHIKELKVLLIALDDVIDNMLTMYENHNSIAAVRKSSSSGPVPMEFYISSEFYCGKNVYLFLSEAYSDIYNMGRDVAPYCQDTTFYFLGFFHRQDDTKYYLLEDPSIAFPTDNYLHGLKCHNRVCMFRFPFKKLLQRDRDVITLPKAIVKCGLVMYKLPPLSAASCIITSGSFILDFNIQGLRYRHHDYLLFTPNGNTYYTKENGAPLICDQHVCEWNYTNHHGGPITVPGDPSDKVPPIPVFVETTTKTPIEEDNATIIDYELDGCFYMYPPNYGSIDGKSYLDSIRLHDNRYRCNVGDNKQGLYWYPQWLGPIPPAVETDTNNPAEPPVVAFEVPPGGVYSPARDDFDDAM
ncbi:uncharacterized protein LOC121729766 [Aricia agestis]|uniref:uncharacterized protein LOC121729766 n=1 Tax=Aricia agestis TaxID=91739 RepID=UPI001C209E9E|nr:uncharacterized protein LOC121729766 [Aricia agestis]